MGFFFDFCLFSNGKLALALLLFSTKKQIRMGIKEFQNVAIAIYVSTYIKFSVYKEFEGIFTLWRKLRIFKKFLVRV